MSLPAIEARATLAIKRFGRKAPLYRPVQPDDDADGVADEDLLGNAPDDSAGSTGTTWEDAGTVLAYRQYESENDTDRDGRGNFSEDNAQILTPRGAGTKGHKVDYGDESYVLLTRTELPGYDVWETRPVRGGDPSE